jgi:hypothetical protein
MPEKDLDKMLALLRALREPRVDSAMASLAAESALAKGWLHPRMVAALPLRRRTSDR